MKKLLLTAALVAAFVMPAASSIAQDNTGPAVTLDQVLRLVNEKTALESAEERKRVEEFRKEKAQQQRLLNEAKAEQARLERESERLENQFNENELRIKALETQLNERQGNLKELFGVVKQNANDLRGQLQDSLTSAQFNDRAEFLDDLGGKSDLELPSIEELRQLWAIYSQELVESGKISKFRAQVNVGEGTEEREVIRVGVFNLVDSDGNYLTYNSDNDQISQAQAQPAGVSGAAEEFASASEGPVGFGIDPSRGAILSTLVHVPSLVGRFHQGGTVGYAIAILGVLGLILAIWRWIALTLTGSKVNAQIKRETADTGNPLGRVMAVYDENRGVDVDTLELKLDEAILKEVPRIETALGIIKVISVVAPLMGLLGTVVGMIITFQAITLYGTGDPQVMANGISSALVTTVLGLVVAIPMTLLYTVVASRARRVVHVLEEQAAGIIAVHAERRAGQGG